MLPSEYYFMTGKPIKLGHKLGTIYQPKLIDFIEEDILIEDFAHPFCVSVDLIDIENEEDLKKLKEVLKNFDLFFLNNSSMLDKLSKSLKILYKTDTILANKENHFILIDNEVILNRDNFDYLSDVVLDMMQMKRPKKTSNKRKYEDDYRQKLWEKMQRYRQENEKKNQMDILDIVNVVLHSNSVIDYDKVFNLTYYQLVNTYSTLMTKIGYEEYMMFKSSGQFKMENEVKHWGITSKVKKGIDL